jgi:hypothetical protein
MTAQRNWGRDVERDAWGGMAQDWTPRFRVMQGFSRLHPRKTALEAEGADKQASTSGAGCATYRLPSSESCVARKRAPSVSGNANQH